MPDDLVEQPEKPDEPRRAQPELLAPAGDEHALDAALEAGADAVYLGMTELNARRRAKNFSLEEFPQAVARAHEHRARVYLTLNIDVAEVELQRVAGMLELAAQTGVDAVLVRDPALLALREHYPQLEFHFSTQTCATNSADVGAAREVGAQRVVLAREMMLSEIAAASAVPGIETEVFVQGALCFCVSGRCLLSSWVGGRSGNRGACTSPCRVPWTVDQQPAGTPLSMRDLATAHRLDDLRQAGVAGLKIEGRLKSADWVRQAVTTYRSALSGAEVPGLEPVASLGGYTGRQLTAGYLDGERAGMTGLAEGRSASPADVSGRGGRRSETDDSGVSASEATYELQVLTGGTRIEIRCECREHVVEWSVPKTVVRRAHKAVAVETLLSRLQAEPVHGHRLVKAATDDPGYLLVPRASNELMSRVSTVIQQALKRRHRPLDIELPAAVRELLAARDPDAANRRTPSDPPDRARLAATDILQFLEVVRPDGGVIVEGATADEIRDIQKACRRIPLIVALPDVFFEDEIAEVEELVHACAKLRTIVEVNSWGGWRLARSTGVRLESGPGLPVLNSLSARALAHLGIQCVTLSMEAGRKQLEQVTSRCSVSCSMVVFGRPALMTSRVELPEAYLGRLFEDRREVRMVPRRHRGLWVFRPVEPFDLRSVRNTRILARHLVVDLVGSLDPVGEWGRPPRPTERPFRFNYDRTLA